VLELAILGRVDEGVDAAVGLQQDHGEVVVPAAEVHRHAARDVLDEDQDLVRRPAHDKAAADDQRYDDCVASGRV